MLCILFSMIRKNEVQVATSFKFPRYVRDIADVQPQNPLLVHAKGMNYVKKVGQLM